MNLKKIAFVLLTATGMAYPNDGATQQLWEGVLTSNVELVRRALEQDADTSLHAGRYQETPLMTALRIYCGSLKTNKAKQKNTIVRYSTAAICSLATGLATLSLMNLVQKKWGLGNPELHAAEAAKMDFNLGFLNASLTKTNLCAALVMGATFLGIMQLPITLVPASAKIVELLIEHDPDLQARNAEGNNALDILLAYFPYAYKYQDKYWYTFLRLLQKGPNQ